MTPTIRAAGMEDIEAIHAVVERAYRGDSARRGWTHEADLLSGARTDRVTLTAILADPAQRLLMLLDDRTVIGCINVARLTDETAYLGLLCIDPPRQADGLGRMLIAAAEDTARDIFGCTRIEMTVITLRPELIAYYERRGYVSTGETRAFPVPVDPPLTMTVLAKPLV